MFNLKYNSKRQECEDELKQRKKVYGSIILKNLPDGGAKLKKKIDELEAELERLSVVEQNRNEVNSEKNDESSSVPEYSKEKHNFEGSTEVINKNCKSEKSPPTKLKLSDNRTQSVVESSLISFADLKNKFDSNSNKQTFSSFKKTFPQSPSFTNYRSDNKGTRLTEAKQLPSHLLNKQSFTSSVNTLGSFSQITGLSRAKTEAVENIHTSLKCCPAEEEEAIEPSGLVTKLMKYQRTGLAWLTWRETQQPPGGILADDMGLGKTLTMIALILKDLENTVSSDRYKGTLVVCLASIIHQWESEIIKHCKDKALKVLLYHGTKRSIDYERMKKYDVVLTTYNLVLSEGKSMQLKNKASPLFQIEWHRIILDEAHTIKNYKSQTAEYVFRLDSKIRWAMTGTPIHNDLKDMYCLLKYLQCKPFDEYQMWKKLITDFSNNSIERRNALVKSILLRRCKDQRDKSGNNLIVLPKKSFVLQKIELSNVERTIYDEVYGQFKAKIGKLLIQDAPSKTPNAGCTFLTLLLKLQQCCNHPSLMKTSTQEDDSYSDSMTDVLDSFASFGIDNTNSNTSKSEDSLTKLDISLSGSSHNFSKTEPSAKIEKLLGEIQKIMPLKEKVVIVSQWVTMLDIIAFHLEKAHIKFQAIRGNTKAESRSIIADDFNNNPNGVPVLLLSLKAGGVGLNLVGGNHMFLLDLHWNPALESQATDRIYRVGQIRRVFIHKFVCSDTIEEKIIAMQEQKKCLSANVLNAAETRKSNLTLEDLKELFEC